MARPLCLGASLLVKLFVEEEDGRAARELAAAALQKGAVLNETVDSRPGFG